MSDREETLLLVNQLTEEVRRLHMAQTVQRGALVVLARHLAAQGLARPQVLEQDLLTMAETQPDPDWRGGFEELAAALALLKDLPSAQP